MHVITIDKNGTSNTISVDRATHVLIKHYKATKITPNLDPPALTTAAQNTD